jgi:hypothetical protein
MRHTRPFTTVGSWSLQSGRQTRGMPTLYLGREAMAGDVRIEWQ